MKRTLILGVAALVVVAFAWREAGGQESSPMAAQKALVNQYCGTCHSDKLKTGDLSLEKLDLDHTSADAETWEKVIRKVRAGLMPPAGARRPERAVLDGFAGALETALDRAATAKPDPGRAPLHR